MNYIIFRQDGSVEQINLTEIITQGDNLVDDIFIAVEGYTDSDFQCRAVVERPDNFVSSLTAVTATFNGYNGYKVTLTSVETQLAGELKVKTSIILLKSHFPAFPPFVKKNSVKALMKPP